jgi:purine-binding chemotaxis protein CheW
MESEGLPHTEPIETRVAPSWCLFRSESKPYAIRIEAVSEIIEAESVVRLPLSPPEVVGFCAFRRDCIPIIRAGEAPGGDGETAVTDPTVLILRTDQGVWGMRIDREGVVVADGNLDSWTGEEARPLGSLGVIRRAEANYAAIDPEAAWRNVRGAIERWYGPDSRRPNGRIDSNN